MDRYGLIDQAIRPLIENWTGAESEHYYTYGGIRIYEEGASLVHHFDAGDHPLSAIIPIWASGGGESTTSVYLHECKLHRH